MSEAINRPLPSPYRVLNEVKLLAQRVGKIRSMLSLLAWACGIRWASKQLPRLHEPVANVDLIIDERGKLRKGAVWRWVRDRLAKELNIAGSKVEEFMAARWEPGLDPMKRDALELEEILKQIVGTLPDESEVAYALSLRQITDEDHGRTSLLDILLAELHEEFPTIAQHLPRPKRSRSPTEPGTSRGTHGEGNKPPAGGGSEADDSAIQDGGQLAAQARGERLLSIQETAKRLNIDRTTLRRWRNAKPPKIPPSIFVTMGSKEKVLESKLDAWISERSKESQKTLSDA